MKDSYISYYEKNHLSKDDERLGLFQRLNDVYSIKKVLYPGSYAHITPSFVFPNVVFNDIYKKLEKFYRSVEIRKYIDKRKLYSGEPFYSYICEDYNNELPIDKNSIDLLVSQYAGFISRACKKYLKVGGLLVVNNSHGDASMASLSSDYEFISVIHKRAQKFTLSTKDLRHYFIPKKSTEITEEFLDKHMRGVGYTKTATDYVFKRIS